MFASGSRYERVSTAIHVDRNGVSRPYVLLRPFPPSAPTRQLHEVTDFERLDLLAHRFFGDPEQFWRLCDASMELRPEDLEVVGRRIPIPLVVR
jgi:hypothetical protein